MKRLSALLLTLSCLGCGYGSPKVAPAATGVVPIIMQLAPNTAKSGDSGFLLTVNGSSFAQNAMVNFNGVAQNTGHMAANQLTAMIPASAIATPGTVPVTVTNPATLGMGGIYGGSGGTAAATSAPLNFTIN
jgi:hypothetical protein